VVAAMPLVKASAATEKAAILVFTDMIDSILVWGGPSGPHANWCGAAGNRFEVRQKNLPGIKKFSFFKLVKH
jgi:hypothetical protein